LTSFEPLLFHQYLPRKFNGEDAKQFSGPFFEWRGPGAILVCGTVLVFITAKARKSCAATALAFESPPQPLVHRLFSFISNSKRLVLLAATTSTDESTKSDLVAAD